MDEERTTIRLNVAQNIVDITILTKWKKYYLEAETIINNSFYKFAKQWSYKDNQDILAKLLIDFVVQGLDTSERLQEYEEDLIPKMQKLKELSDKIATE